MSTGLAALTLLHVVISLTGIMSGLLLAALAAKNFRGDLLRAA